MVVMTSYLIFKVLASLVIDAFEYFDTTLQMNI